MDKVLKSFRKDLIIIFIIMAVFYLQHLLSFRQGINFEEGRDGNAYFLAMQGYRPYRDFEWVYGPFSFLIYPLIMKTFGVNLIVMRLAYIIFVSLVIPLTYFLSRAIMPSFWSGMAAFLAINFFDVPYYTINHIFAVLGELGCLLMIIRGIKMNKLKTYLCWAGFFTAITLLTKPFFSGANLFFSILLFMILFKINGQIPIKFTTAITLFVGTAFLPTALFIYFYLGGAIKNYFLGSIPFSPDPVGQLYNVGRTDFLAVITRFSNRLFEVFAINKILTVVSFNGFKKNLVGWFDNFIFLLPFFIPLAIFIIYKRFEKIDATIQGIFKKHRTTILLFIIFSLIISMENLTVGHQMSRAFNIQITFVLLVFFFHLILNIVPKNIKMFIFSSIVIFVFLLSFLHFFRYPWARNKKFTESLNLERAKGVLVTSSEKYLYESLSDYLSTNFTKDDKAVILGYNPQFSFLTGQKNIFENEEGVFLKLQYLTALSLKNEKMLSKLKVLEGKIINTIESQKPKMVLDIVFQGAGPLYNNFVGDYIKKKYILNKTFGPAEIRGDDSGIGRVDLYILKGNLTE